MKNNKRSLVMSVILAGSIAVMSGCAASGKTAAESTSDAAVEVHSVQETETEIQSETESAAETETETETETEINTEDLSETQTIPETVPQSEAAEETVSQPESAPEPVAVSEGSVSEGDYAVLVKGISIPLGGDMQNYAGLLGEPDAFDSAKSCTEAGEDKVYTYDGAIIYTYITNGADIISLIEVTGSETLSSGIHIGSTKDEVIAAYGSSYTQEGTELLYEMGNKTIGLQMANDQVSFIELFGR